MAKRLYHRERRHHPYRGCEDLDHSRRLDRRHQHRNRCYHRSRRCLGRRSQMGQKESGRHWLDAFRGYLVRHRHYRDWLRRRRRYRHLCRHQYRRHLCRLIP